MSMMGWVNFGRAEAEAVQTLIGALSDSDARDELGLGAIRDGFADLLFPGTSTVQTRLRYFLLLPQLFRNLTLKPNADHRASLRVTEIALIERFKKLTKSDTEQLIGVEAEGKLKRMPSSVYWGGLGAWGIRMPELQRSGIGEVLERMAQGDNCWADTPVIAASDDRGFKITGGERDYLMDRISNIRLDEGGTLLGNLVCTSHKKTAKLQYLGDVKELSVSEKNLNILEHALSFSLVMHGAALIYNLMLSEHFGDKEKEIKYANELRDWQVEFERNGPLCKNAHSMISPLSQNRELIGFMARMPTLQFIDDWLSVLGAPTGKASRELIRQRERDTKGPKARLDFAPQDYQWSGGSGAGRMTFRWDRVKQYLKDLARAE